MSNDVEMSAAPQYRKRAKIRAFYNRDGAIYFKSWGEQKLPGPHYVIVGPTGDIYGCAASEFEAMYQPVPGEPDTYRKTLLVRALRMAAPFTVRTTTGDGNVEVARNQGQAGDWLVQQPGGERQVIPAASFAELYEPVP